MLQKQMPHRPPSRLIRFLEYFVTPAGRRLSFYLAGAGTLGIVSANYLPHTIFVEDYRDIIQHYTFGIPTKVPVEIIKRIDLAAEKLNINESDRRLIKPFTVTNFNVATIGSLCTIYGGWIGVPSNFYYESVADIDKTNVFIRNEPVKWNSEHGRLLEQSLILSDAEQLFAFCRALMDLQSFKLYLHTFAPAVSFLAMYSTAQKINRSQNLYSRPFLVRYVVYALLGIFGYGLCSFITDFVNFQHDREVDVALAELGPEMVEAGIGFYAKQINRNIAIRELSGLDLYTATGNEKYFMRIRAMPLTVRKCFFENKLEELNKSEESPPNESDDQEEIKPTAADVEQKPN